jgi:signal transduction histidine kinase
LHLPEIEQLSVDETVRRATRDHERKTGLPVPLSLENLPAEAPLPVRITLYRLLQESLSNGFRHGGGTQRVSVKVHDGNLAVEVADDGKGFDPNASITSGHLGLEGMRERVELLGGTFNVQSAPNQGAVVRASLPLEQPERADG